MRRCEARPFAGLPECSGSVGMCSHRQSPPKMVMDVRVNGDHTPFTPLPSLERAFGCS